MSPARAREIIWSPDDHPLSAVAEASLVVLENRFSASQDVQQATHLITTFRRVRSYQEDITR